MNRIAMLLGLACLLTIPAWAQDKSTDSSTKRKPTFRESATERMTGDKYADMVGRRGNGPAPGTMAPDFALQPLKFYEFHIDDTDITEENAGDLYKKVRLSDFRGKRPVVLVFGSYT